MSARIATAETIDAWKICARSESLRYTRLLRDAPPDGVAPRSSARAHRSDATRRARTAHGAMPRRARYLRANTAPEGARRRREERVASEEQRAERAARRRRAGGCRGGSYYFLCRCRFRSLRCLCFRIFLRRFLITLPLGVPRLGGSERPTAAKGRTDTESRAPRQGEPGPCSGEPEARVCGPAGQVAQRSGPCVSTAWRTAPSQRFTG
jgi:hypothetical protein